MDDLQTIQCAKDFLEQLKMSFFIQIIGNITTCDDFITELEKYLIWFKNKRIKKRLGYLFSKEFMLNYSQY